MIHEGILEGVTSPPTREHISKWTIQAKETIMPQIVKNTWRYTQYSWFINDNTDNN